MSRLQQYHSPKGVYRQKRMGTNVAIPSLIKPDADIKIAFTHLSCTYIIQKKLSRKQATAN